MRKKLLISCITALLLVLAASAALADYCHACGLSIYTGADSCIYCGSSQSYSSSALRILSISPLSDGTVSIRWNKSNTAPYTIYCFQKLTNDVTSDMVNPDSFGPRPAAARSFYSSSGSVTHLTPGQDYWIVILDAYDDMAFAAYTPGAAPIFPDFTTSITLQLKSRYNNAYTERSTFSAATIAASPNTAFGTYIRLDYPQLARERHYTGLVSITAPNGAVLTEDLLDVTLPNGRSYSYIIFYDLTWYFQNVINRFGSVIPGNYQLSLYYDGMYVATQSFRITD